MTIDSYAICPCGNGKKIKFCKCKDSVHELDRVTTMIEGGQVIPALDRLSSILDEHPDAAWALAIRGRVLMDLREYDSMAENAERFIRLQPSNPIALAQRAAARLVKQDVEGATESLLEALTESGQTVDSFLLDISSLLSLALANTGVWLTSRVYATLAVVSTGYQDGEMAKSVLQQLTGNPEINQLVKTVPDLLPRPSQAAWGERYDEAAALLSANKVVLAESKFESLRRTATGEPAVLSGLLMCAIWRGDAARQAELLERLSECEPFSQDQRASYLAMSGLVAASDTKFATPVVTIEYLVESADEAHLAMVASDRMVEVPSEQVKELRDENDVRPKSLFLILDRPKLEGESVPPTAEIPEEIGRVVLFGKQTDRSARIEAINLLANNRDGVVSLLGSLVPDLPEGNEEERFVPMHLVAPPIPGGVRLSDPKQAMQVSKAFFDDRLGDRLASLPVKALGGRSLREVADDDSQQPQKAAVLRYLEGFDLITGRYPTVIDHLYELTSIGAPAAIPVKTDDDVEAVSNQDLNRIDSSELNLEGLVYLVQRCQQVSATIAGLAAARRLISLPVDANSEDDSPALRLMAYVYLIQSLNGSDESISLLEEAKSFAESHGLPDASLLFLEIPIRARRMEAPEAQQAIQTLATKYQDNPEVMARLQQLLMEMGLIRPDGELRRERTAEAQPSSGPGLWTPGQGNPAATPAPAPAASGGAPSESSAVGSKLWVPGMD
ncbi:MAG: protein-disulfide isomerase [Planctomycetota bacterium]